jgi:ComF family protein
MHAGLRTGFADTRWRWLSGACEACRRWSPGRLCADCLARFAPPVPRCRRCALAVAGGVDVCGHCRVEPPAFDRSLCVADYGFPWDRLVTRFKYGQAPELAALLVDALADAARRQQMAVPQAFVALPLSDARLAVRGYDQSWELARGLGRRFGVPAHARLLERRFDAQPQARLARAQRLRNLVGAFAVPPSASACVAGRHLALVDDVMTTGATAGEAARTLLQAGAARIDLWLVARTPPPPDSH